MCDTVSQEENKPESVRLDTDSSAYKPFHTTHETFYMCSIQKPCCSCCPGILDLLTSSGEEFALGIDPKCLHATVLMQTVYNAVIRHSREFLKHVVISVTEKSKDNGGVD